MVRGNAMGAFIAYGAAIAAVVGFGMFVGAIVSMLDENDARNAERQKLIDRNRKSGWK
jgi:hypothetical protein